MNFKLRAHIIIALIVVAVSAAFTFFHISNESRYAQERTQRSSENVKMAFESMIRDSEHFYTFRAYANIRSEGVNEAIKNRDTETLYRLTLPRYKTLKEENLDLTIMQFHAADGRSILRMHMKEQYGDYIALRRPMLQKVHATHKTVTGFEGGIGGMAYRVITPVFRGEAYIGALEFGIDNRYFINKLKETTGADSILMIHRNVLGAVDHSLYPEKFGEYRYPHLELNQNEIIRAFVKNNRSAESRIFHYGNNDYEVSPIFLKDTDGKNIGMIVCINNVTGSVQDIVETVVKSLLLTIFLVAVFWGLFEYVFRSLIGRVNLQEQYIHTILNSQNNMVIVTDGTMLIYANQSFLDYFGYPTIEDFFQDHPCVCDYFESGESNEYLLASMEGVRWTDYLTLYNRQEHKVKITVDHKTSIFTISSQKMEYDRQVRHVVVFTDITKLNELATLDVLTQTSNRFQFDKILDHSIMLAGRNGRALSILLLDIDYFKQVNDRYGHLTGDEVLKSMAKILSKNIRQSDTLARWGGEEFVILLPECDLSSAHKMGEMLRLKIEQGNYDPVERVTCSIGVAQWAVHEDSDQLLRRVDEKLYKAKEGGRNRVVS